MIRLALPLLVLLLPAMAAAQERVGLRTGTHQGHARLVFDWPRETQYRVAEADGQVTLRFAAPAAFDLTAPQRGLRNLRDIAVNPPAGWSRKRRREYYDWARRVIDGVRGAHPGLERIFDRAYARRPS